MKEFLSQLKSLSTSIEIKNSKEDCKTFGMDWTRVEGEASIVLLPKTTEDVAKILKLCSETGTAVIPSGGRTGLAGGAVASKNEVVLSLTRMNQIEEVDEVGYTIRVQAGAVTENVHEATAKSGLTWPIDLAAKGTSTIGGNLSTNAGGLKVIRYGMARKWVTAVQAVTMSGEVIEINRGLEKNNTGYDLIQLLVGSEGTLAVITEATLKLTRIPKKLMVLFFALDSVEKLDALFLTARRGPFQIQAMEFFSSECLKVVQKKLNRKSRLTTEGKFYIVLEIEAESHSESQTAIEAWLSTLLEKQIVLDGLLAHSSEDQKQVWGLREGITESLQQTSLVKKFDVAVPVCKMVDFLNQVDVLFKNGKYALDLYIFGHYGDGSPHLNLLMQEGSSKEQFLSEYARLEKDLFPFFKQFHGSISAEHGVGLLKKHWVTYSRSPEELRIFKAIKRAFDPQNLLNPGKLIDL